MEKTEELEETGSSCKLKRSKPDIYVKVQKKYWTEKIKLWAW